MTKTKTRTLLALAITLSMLISAWQVDLTSAGEPPPPPPETCIDLEKTGPETAYPGETITYRFWVHNCGDIVLHGGAQVYDLLFGDDPIWNGVLEPGAFAEFDKTYTLPNDYCGEFINSAWAVGHPLHPDGYYLDDVTDDANWTVEVTCEPEPTPSIDIEKYVSDDGETWYDADTPDEALEVMVGSDVYFKFWVKNTGDVELTNITLSDDQYDVSSCTLTDPLAPDAYFECVIGPFTAMEGWHVNTATATGDYGGETYKDTDRAKYFGYSGAASSIDIEKYVSVDDQATWQDADTPPGPEVLAGSETVWFEFVVTNDGDVTLTNITLSDSDFDAEIASQCTVPDELAPGESFECVIGPFVAIEGQHVNTGTATGDYGGKTYKDTDRAKYYGYSGAAPSIDIEKYVSVDDQATWHDADAPPGPEVLAGSETVWFEFVVTNDGDVTLTNITLSDSDFNAEIAIQCTVPGELAAGASFECVIGPFTAIEGQHVNTGTAMGDYDGQTYDDTDRAKYYGYPGVAPSIDIEKSTNGQDADTPTGPQIPVGDPVLWEYLVTNIGNVPLTNVTVTDDQGVTVSCPQTTLAVGESMTCSATGTATEGQYENLGTATGTPPVGPDVSDSDPSHYIGVIPAAPSIDIEKSTNGQDADTPTGPQISVGDPVLWEYLVTNIGNVPLTNVTVTDDQGVTVSCPQTTLAVGESMTCSATGTATEGQYENLGTATGTPPVGPDVSDSDPSHYIGVIPAAPSIDIEKSTNGQDADTPTGPQIPVGDPVLWEYLVTNIGNVPLTNVTVTDDQGVTVSCPQTTLAVGESMTCSATGTATEGQYENLGTATGTPPVGPDVSDSDPSHYIGVIPAAPSIDIEKSTNGQDADTPTGPQISVGDPVLWEYLVTNIGNVPLTNVTVTDDQGVTVSCPQTTLAVGESMTCSATGTATEGQYENLGTATGTPPVGPDVSDSDPSHYIGVIPTAPSIDIEKSTNGQDADTPTGPQIPVGDPVNWAYLVTNTGNVDLTNVTVTDDQGVTVSCPQTTLAVGESMTCSATGTATEGQYENLGTATGAPPVGPDVSDSDPSHYIGVIPAAPSIDIEKSTNGQDADTPTGPQIPVGDPVLWEYLVTNIGNVPLTNVTVTDDQGVTVSCPQTTLAVGESMTCSATGTATEGQYENLGTATGTPPVGPDVSDSDPSHYIGVIPAAPSIDIEKSTNGQDADTPTGPQISVGDPVLWEYLVTNIGNVPLTNVTVTDDQGVTVSCPQTTLAVGESMTCSATGTATEGQYENLGTATGTPPVGPDVSDSDPSHYIGVIPAAPSIDIEKSTDGQDADTLTGPQIPVGDPVNWAYLVTNTGNVDLTNVTVTDDQGVTVSCPQTTLAVGESMTCSATGTATEGQYENLGTATGTPPVGPDVSDSDPSHYFGTGEEWDKSSLYFSAGCEGGCERISATVCNGDDSGDMAGTTTWELYWIASGNPQGGVVIASGIINALAAGECQTLTYDPSQNPNGASGNYMFKAYQRPGHPGTGVLWSEACELECEGNWYDPAWAYRRAVNISNLCGETATDFQVRVTLDSTFDFGNAQPDGSDLRVTDSDGTAPIPLGDGYADVFRVQKWCGAEPTVVVVPEETRDTDASPAPSPVQRTAPVAAAGAVATTGLASVAWWLLRRKLLLL